MPVVPVANATPDPLVGITAALKKLGYTPDMPSDAQLSKMGAVQRRKIMQAADAWLAVDPSIPGNEQLAFAIVNRKITPAQLSHYARLNGATLDDVSGIKDELIAAFETKGGKGQALERSLPDAARTGKPMYGVVRDRATNEIAAQGLLPSVEEASATPADEITQSAFSPEFRRSIPDAAPAGMAAPAMEMAPVAETLQSRKVVAAWLRDSLVESGHGPAAKLGHAIERSLKADKGLGSLVPLLTSYANEMEKMGLAVPEAAMDNVERVRTLATLLSGGTTMPEAQRLARVRELVAGLTPIGKDDLLVQLGPLAAAVRTSPSFQTKTTGAVNANLEKALKAIDKDAAKALTRRGSAPAETAAATSGMTVTPAVGGPTRPVTVVPPAAAASAVAGEVLPPVKPGLVDFPPVETPPSAVAPPQAVRPMVAARGIRSPAGAATVEEAISTLPAAGERIAPELVKDVGRSTTKGGFLKALLRHPMGLALAVAVPVIMETFLSRNRQEEAAMGSVPTAPELAASTLGNQIRMERMARAMNAAGPGAQTRLAQLMAAQMQVAGPVPGSGTHGLPDPDIQDALVRAKLGGQ